MNEKTRKLSLVQFIVMGLLLIIVFLYAKTFQICKVDGESMVPTLKNEQMLLMKKTHNVKRQDIIVFEYSKNRDFIKRVIATEGDYIKIKNSKVYVNGIQLKETYINEKTFDGEINEQVPDGYIFAMGDNRNNSMDSREIGFVKLSQVNGKIVYRGN